MFGNVDYNGVKHYFSLRDSQYFQDEFFVVSSTLDNVLSTELRFFP